ncbi:MAG: hypothetical protein AABY97_06845 [Chloroflexota bacterium]
MRWPTRIFGILLILVGVVWFLQGINVLPGSFMTGQPEWTVAGALAFLAGLWIMRRSRRASSPSGRG